MFSLILFFVCSIIYLQLSFKDFSSTHIKCFSWYFLQLKISLVLTLQMFSLILSPFKISLVLTLQMFFLNTLSFFSFWDKFKLKLLKIFSDTRINAFSDTLLHVDCSTCNYLLKTLLHRYSYFHLHYWTKLCMSYMFVFKYIMCIEISPILTQSVFSATISCHKTNFTRNAFKFKLQL